jgi:hypothetical protein
VLDLTRGEDETEPRFVLRGPDASKAPS